MEHAVLQIGLDPRAAAGASAEPAGGAPVDGVHGGVAGVGVGVLTAAVVEAAPLVRVVRRRHHVNAFGLGSGGHAARVVEPVADAGGDLDPEDLVAGRGHRQGHGVRSDVGSTWSRSLPVAAPGHRQVVVLGGLVVDLRDRARRARAERHLGRGVRVSAGAEHLDVAVAVIGGPLNLVQRPVVRREKRPGGGVRRHTRRTARGIEVTRKRRVRHAVGRRMDDGGRTGPRGCGERRCAERGHGHRQGKKEHGLPSPSSAIAGWFEHGDLLCGCAHVVAPKQPGVDTKASGRPRQAGPDGPAGTRWRRGRGAHPSLHRWLLPPLQVHSWARVPSAPAAPVTSRHRPDWTPVIVPLEFSVHCWLV